ncbi:MAG: hypothetical protein H0X67_05035, partial [Acidobacteria bacterium]|nr:hypothetical protein [Acidobacteriota bacterium]
MFLRLFRSAILAVSMCAALVVSTAGQQKPPTHPPAKPIVPGEQTPAPPQQPEKPGTPPQGAPQTGGAPPLVENAYASTYVPLPSRPTLIRNATILTAAGPAIQAGSILLQDGKIAAVGADVAAPPGAFEIDAAGRWITPGIIDTHSHLGVYPMPGIPATSDGNEMTNPNTAEVSAEHAIWPQDPQFELALAGGVTAMHILPGSA